MENNSSRYNRASQPHASNFLKQRRSGYEPSDTETDWQDTPQHDQIHNKAAFGPVSPILELDLPRKVSPMKHTRRHSSKFNNSSPKKDLAASPPRRRHHSKSPYKTQRDDRSAISPMSTQTNVSPLLKSASGRQVSPYKARRDDGRAVSPLSSQRNVSPLLKPEPGRQVSTYKYGRKEHDMPDNDEIVGSNRRKNQRAPNMEERGTDSQYGEVSKMSGSLTYSYRSITPPSRAREKDQENSHAHNEQKEERTPSPLSRNMIHTQGQKEASHKKAPSVGELNETVANIKIYRSPMFNDPNFESTESVSPGDIFFSRDRTALAMQKNGSLQNDKNGTNLYLRPTRFPHIDSVLLQRNKANGNIEHKPQRTLSSSGSRTTMTSISAASRQSSSKLSSENSKTSDTSGTTSGSLKRFTANRRKSQANAWFSCMRRGPCKTSRSPEKNQYFDEASFLEKAFVVESLRQFWADKHQPGSLNGFTCHKQEAQILSQLVSHDGIPHILFKGPSGSGKRALAMALIGEIFGDACWNKSHDLRYFQVQEQRAMQVAVPITSSANHVELNVNLEPNAKYALMGLVKEISNTFAIAPEVSDANLKPDYKVIFLYEVDKAAENIQHLIKWIMDGYTDACKLILCCEDDAIILETVKNRCKVIKIDAPITHEIMEVLIQIAKKEDFELPMSFAAKIATKSKQNLRKAIMALEACKAHNYPFADDQPIPFGWEEVLVELAAEILADPSPKRLFSIRGKLQKLLVDFVHPKLILLKLVEQFLKGVEANSKRELYYWHAYYDKKLPTGTSALLKLEEFVAKVMSICRKSSGSHQYV